MTLDPDDGPSWVTPDSTMPIIRVYVYERGVQLPQSHWMRIPRIPVPGDRITGPDDFPTWTVTGVDFEYPQGTYHEPQVNVSVVE